MMSSASAVGVDELDRPGDDAPERVAPDRRPRARSRERLARARVEPVAGEGDPRRPARAGTTSPACGPRLERVRPADLVLVERVAPSRRARGRGRRSRRSGPRSSGSRSGGAARRAAARARTAGGSSAATTATVSSATSSAASSSGRRAVISDRGGDVIEAADADGDGMDRPAAERARRGGCRPSSAAAPRSTSTRWSRASSIALG